jgi:DNA-binding NarL/FixJ family response regulator
MQPVSILVADDDLHIRQCLRRALEIDSRLRVLWEAENGLQALVLANQHHPDVVLLDAEMPRMDGFEAARCLRRHCSGVRVVIMSVYEHARTQAMEAGAHAFIVKGCGCTELRSMLHRVLLDEPTEPPQ